MTKTTTILLFALLIGFSAKAQNETEKNTPKVGLVLSGGGAKGLAHIGVLKVIDSLGIKVDYVAGTSMGAIIGGLYATGYSGKQLDSIFHEIDFDKLINDDLPRKSKAFYERNNTERYAVKLPFDNFKIKFPSALSRGQNTYNLFYKLILPISETHDFSKLPVPFFCIATNVETGEPIVLESGDLTQAIMASSALPSLYQPVIIDNKVLIDGGVVNNYPIEELREKGMNVIIGVDVQDGLLDRKGLTSAPDVLLQINNFRTINDMKLKKPQTDIYVQPDIKDYNVVSFDEGREIIENGKKAALEKLENFAALPKRTTVHSIKNQVLDTDTISISKLSIKGINNYTRAYILGKLKLKLNEKLCYTDFIEGTNSLIATNNFDSFRYKLTQTETLADYNLETELTETKNTTFLKLGVHFDDLYKSAILINVTKKKLLFKNDIASFDFILGDNVRYNFDYLIDKGFYWSVGFRSSYNTFNKNISAQLLLEDSEIDATGLNKIGTNLKDQTNQFYLQTLFKKDFALSLGAEHKRLEFSSENFLAEEQDEDFDFEKTDYLSVFGNLKIDTYDNKYFPKKGFYFNGDVHTYLFASNFNEDFENFSIAKAEIGSAFSLSNKFAVNLKTSGGFKMGDNSTKSFDFALGGYGNNLINNFTPFIGYDFISVTGNSFVKAYASADYEIIKKHHIMLEANWANVDDNIFKSGEWFSLPDYRGYGLGYSLETLIGPIEVKYTYSPEQNESIWFFNLGFWF